LDTVAPFPAASKRLDLPAPSAAPTDKSAGDSRAFERMLQKLGYAKNDQTDAKASGTNATRAQNAASKNAPRSAQTANDKQPAKSATNSGDSDDGAAAKAAKASAAGSNTSAATDAATNAQQTPDTAPATTTAATDETDSQAPVLAVLTLQAEAPLPVAAPAIPAAPAAATPVLAPTEDSAKPAAAAVEQMQAMQAIPAAPVAAQSAAAPADATAPVSVTADNPEPAAVPAQTPDATQTASAQAAPTTATAVAAAQAVSLVMPTAEPAAAHDTAQTAQPVPGAKASNPQLQPLAQPVAEPTKHAAVKQETAKEPDATQAEPEPAKSFAEHVAAAHDAHEQAPQLEAAAKPATAEAATPQIETVRGTPGQSHGVDAARAAQSDATLVLAPKNPALAASAVAQVGFHLARAGADGQQAITIQLRPEELGSIEVKLDIGRDGVVHAQVVADRSDTLDLLRSDPRGLQRALENAGLTTDGGSLSFDLRQGGHGPQHGATTAQANFDGGSDDAGTDFDIDVVERPRVVADGRVDVTV
jgi:flagellar hook-length control protein FliK